MVFFVKGEGEKADKGVRAGKSFGVCTVCGQKFKLKKKSKHNKEKIIKALCSICGVDKEKQSKKKK